jgi:hypothetical protein
MPSTSPPATTLGSSATSPACRSTSARSRTTRNRSRPGGQARPGEKREPAGTASGPGRASAVTGEPPVVHESRAGSGDGRTGSRGPGCAEPVRPGRPHPSPTPRGGRPRRAAGALMTIRAGRAVAMIPRYVGWTCQSPMRRSRDPWTRIRFASVSSILA